MAGPEGIIPGTAFSVVLVCATKDEIETLFARLGEEGKVGHPLEEAFFGTIGDCTDRFGVHWMLQCPMQSTPKPPAAKRTPSKATTRQKSEHH